MPILDGRNDRKLDEEIETFKNFTWYPPFCPRRNDRKLDEEIETTRCF